MEYSFSEDRLDYILRVAEQLQLHAEFHMSAYPDDYQSFCGMVAEVKRIKQRYQYAGFAVSATEYQLLDAAFRAAVAFESYPTPKPSLVARLKYWWRFGKRRPYTT